MSTKRKKKQTPSYMETIQGEVMLTLGQRIFYHRGLLNQIIERGGDQIEDIGATIAVTEMDRLYQASLDGILDSLSDCLDMNLAKEAITAIRDSMNIKRGLVRMEKA
jgi:hypothetical protein